ncbi:hypothetical protein ACMZOO_12085 [Catenovulum sp. SX2]|uniref:hypothetical protein n=1 Tax=Catenovulum sp. SX2 TaxID=3398614 RepID=UPI003F8549B0
MALTISVVVIWLFSDPLINNYPVAKHLYPLSYNQMLYQNNKPNKNNHLETKPIHTT